MNKFALKTIAAAAVAIASIPASAVPILGGTLTYTGGNVIVTSLPVSSGYTSELGLYDPTTLTRLTNATFTTGVIMFDEPSGVIQDITSLITDNGITAGSELLFGIRVVDTGDTFFMGAASRNADGVLHAGVDTDGGMIVVGFEDLYGGGDMDYNDNIFKFEGALTPSIPEPASLLLAGLGLIGLGVARRRR